MTPPREGGPRGPRRPGPGRSGRPGGPRRPRPEGGPPGDRPSGRPSRRLDPAGSGRGAKRPARRPQGERPPRRHRDRPAGRGPAAAPVSPPPGLLLVDVELAEVTIEKLVAGGEGLARYQGVPLFVARSAPGDRLRVRIVERRPGYGRAEIVE